jgi:hypothetical protein
MKESLYRVYFQGLKYPQPSWEVVKLDEDGNPVITYIVSGRKCQCQGYERHHQYCRHLRMRDFFEENNRPICFLRISGQIHVFTTAIEDFSLYCS